MCLPLQEEAGTATQEYFSRVGHALRSPDTWGWYQTLLPTEADDRGQRTARRVLSTQTLQVRWSNDPLSLFLLKCELFSDFHFHIFDREKDLNPLSHIGQA